MYVFYYCVVSLIIIVCRRGSGASSSGRMDSRVLERFPKKITQTILREFAVLGGEDESEVREKVSKAPHDQGAAEN